MARRPGQKVRDGRGGVSDADRADSKKKVAINKAEQKAAFSEIVKRHNAIGRDVAKLRDAMAKIDQMQKDEEEKRKLREKVAKAVAKVLKDAQDMVKSQSGTVVVDKALDAQLMKFASANTGNFLVILAFLVSYFLQKKPKKA
ncbi:hypothetical protein M1105_13265 [Limibaculum sp. FT325]|uniref:hypothetical protein n=1 Tax=Thermohalobaculum sediminis TaxID=2939436 RepID=UPI0020BF36C3|nr:hypothetical protein [Limibaculum sediminis]MCL5777952.1 hypothetical protein [Limibaculum sediminis]